MKTAEQTGLVTIYFPTRMGQNSIMAWLEARDWVTYPYGWGCSYSFWIPAPTPSGAVFDW